MGFRVPQEFIGLVFLWCLMCASLAVPSNAVDMVNLCSSGFPNGVLNGGEECDGFNFGEYSGLCSDYNEGYTFGSLFCTSHCTIDVSACTPGVCGNGVCEIRTESHFDCPADCTGVIGEDYWIIDGNNPSCSDTSPNAGTLEVPFCRFYAQTYSQLNPGGTIYFRDGPQRLAGYWFWDNQANGEPGNFVTLRNFPGEQPILEKGNLLSAEWEVVEDVGTQRIWKANGVLGPAVFNGQGRVTNYPLNFMRGIERPLSAYLSYDELRTLLSVPYSDDSLEGYYIDCTDGTLFLRLDQGVNPNVEGVYGTAVQTQGDFSYVRFSGLIIQHAAEGIKIRSPASYNQILDSTIQSVQMGFEDVGGSNTLIQNVIFRGIAPLMYIEPESGPSHA